ncbi:hypothetical protein IAD21_00309 [Abditibacteriota bacterium]|nr:hypothetical protein IAD21_00309 [Abditibacteriota bacterium]
MAHTPNDTAPLWEGEHLSGDALARWRSHSLPPAQVVAVSEHLAVCEQCRAQLASPAALLLLAQALENGTPGLDSAYGPEGQHLRFEQMEAFVDELLTPAGRRNVEQHLASCATCSMQVADLRAVQHELHEWQASSQQAPESVAALPVSANEAALHPSVAQKSSSASGPVNSTVTVASPPRVPLTATIGERVTRNWADSLRAVQRWLLPLETAGVAVAAIFLLLIAPSRQELERLSAENQRFASQNGLSNEQLSKSQSQNERLENQLQGLQKRVARLDQQNATTRQQSQHLAQNNAALASQLNDSQSQLHTLQEQQRRDRERFDQRLPVNPPPAVSPTLTPSNSATPVGQSDLRVFNDGPNALILRQGEQIVRVTNAQTLSADASRALSQGLQTPAAVEALRVQAPTSKSTDTPLRFHLLSPVGTRVREVRPLLRWEAVPGATSYRVALSDETDLQAPLLQSGLLTGSQWQPEELLTRGHRYTWTVQAWSKDPRSRKLHLLGDAPHKPDLAGKFELLSQAQENALQARLADIKDSPLQKSVVLAEAGIMDEARQQLALVTPPAATSAHPSPRTD